MKLFTKDSPLVYKGVPRPLSLFFLLCSKNTRPRDVSLSDWIPKTRTYSSKLIPFSSIYIYIHIYLPFYHDMVDTKKLLQGGGWIDEDGNLIPDSEDEVVRVYDESPDFYASAYQAFNQGHSMPPRR